MLKINMQPRLLNVNRIPGQPKKRKKITIVFDEDKRREFLKGFRKRKLQRKQKALEKLQQQLKEERKKIKQGTREYYKNLVSNRDIPEIQQLLSQQEYETEGHTISILELNVADLAENNTLIGENKGTVEVENNETEENDNNNSECEEEIMGMPLTEKKGTIVSKKAVESKLIESQKDFKKAIKKAALKKIKASKAFQRKQKLERQKNKKESTRKLRRKEKIQKHNQKLKKSLKH